MIYTIEEIRRKVVPIAKKYGVKRLSLFGSYARGEADEKSDVDFIFNKGNGKIRGMLSYFSFVYDLQDELNCHVDLISEGIEDKNFLATIKQDEVLLYEETA